jgi:hypothetical protein
MLFQSDCALYIPTSTPENSTWPQATLVTCCPFCHRSDVALWIWFAFSWGLRMLKACVCCPFASLWRNVIPFNLLLNTSSLLHACVWLTPLLPLMLWRHTAREALQNSQGGMDEHQGKAFSLKCDFFSILMPLSLTPPFCDINVATSSFLLPCICIVF